MQAGELQNLRLNDEISDAMHWTAGFDLVAHAESRRSRRVGCRAQSSDVKAPLSETSMGHEPRGRVGRQRGGSS